MHSESYRNNLTPAQCIDLMNTARGTVTVKLGSETSKFIQGSLRFLQSVCQILLIIGRNLLLINATKLFDIEMTVILQPKEPTQWYVLIGNCDPQAAVTSPTLDGLQSVTLGYRVLFVNQGKM